MAVRKAERTSLRVGRCRVVDRGPNWLFVRVDRPDTTSGRATSGQTKRDEALALAEQLWELSEQHFVYRIVLEMDGVEKVDRPTIDALRKLRRRLAKQGGVLRLCGLTEDVAEDSQRGDLCSHSSWHGAVVGDPSEAPSRHPATGQLK